MKLTMSLLLMVFAVSTTGALAISFTDIGAFAGNGMSADGLAISYNSGNVVYIWSEAYGSVAVTPAGYGAYVSSIGIANAAGKYAIAYNANPSFNYQTHVWMGGLDGVGTTTIDPFSTSTTNYLWARCIGGDATQAYIGGHQVAGGNQAAARWKAPSGSVAAYGQPSGFHYSLYYFYGASNKGTYSGWGRLASSGSVSNKSQAFANEGSTLISLDNAWGDPSTEYYSNAYISGDGQTCFGYTGLSDNSTALPCFWDRSQYGTWTTNTTCNLIPLLSGYAKGYAMKSSGDAGLIGGWTIKASGEWGIDRRTIFLFNKASGTVMDLRQWLIGNGVDLSGWGLMDIIGISADGTKLAGTMLAADDTYWTTGTVAGPYHTWVAVIPEPGSLLALASGLIGLVGFSIRRAK